MPIEVRELVIRATISQEGSASAQTSSSTQSANATSTDEHIINTCVEKVLEILKMKNQR